MIAICGTLTVVSKVNIPQTVIFGALEPGNRPSGNALAPAH
jgi:hypothetical protein